MEIKIALPYEDDNFSFHTSIQIVIQTRIIFQGPLHLRELTK